MFKFRFFCINSILALLFCILIVRLFQIQIINGVKYTKRSREQSKCRTIVSANRGTIRDRQGTILAKSMVNTIQLTADNALKNTNNAKKVSASIQRLYPFGELASTVLGYVGKDGYGLAGIEYYFDEHLRGEDGWRIIQKDGRNKRYARIGMPQKKSVNGHDIYLTLDLQIQKIVENVLDQTVKKFNAQGGMCVVMDPLSGDILAMASKPDYNPNAWKLYDSKYRKNRCISYIYEPGSTFKVISAAAALQENIFAEEDSINGDNGIYKVYNQVIRDHEAYKTITFSKALQVSSNVCFAKIADTLGNERFYRYVKDFGLGSKSDISLPGEEVGIVHPIQKWSGRTRVTMAIGQEISTTLLQMMVVFSSIANGGFLVEPRIFTKIVDSKGNLTISKNSKVKRRVLSQEVSSRLRHMLQGVVEKGTAKKSFIPGLAIGGKTGTSQKIDQETKGYSKEKVWVSFIGFTPVDNPNLVCGILIDEPEHGKYGGTVACPAFKNILRQIISHPDLKYAECLIQSDTSFSVYSEVPDSPVVKKIVPDLCGKNRNEAQDYLISEGFQFKIIGSGQSIVVQKPSAGSFCDIERRLVLYTDVPKVTQNTQKPSQLTTHVPDCVGKDLKDAVNTLNLKGIVPYVLGAGIVRRQNPSVGSKIKSMIPCTLVCSFEG